MAFFPPLHFNYPHTESQCSITFADTPATIQLDGTSFVTTELAPIVTLSPITGVPKMHAPTPITQLSPITAPSDRSSIFFFPMHKPGLCNNYCQNNYFLS